MKKPDPDDNKEKVLKRKKRIFKDLIRACKERKFQRFLFLPSPPSKKEESLAYEEKWNNSLTNKVEYLLKKYDNNDNDNEANKILAGITV